MIKVIIERRIMPGLEDEYEQAAREVMRVSLCVRGFDSGETLAQHGIRYRRLMITNGRDLRAGNVGPASVARATAMQRILPLLTEDETIRIYEAGY